MTSLLRAAVVACAMSACAAAPVLAQPAPAPNGPRMLVVPFDCDARKPTTYWLGEGLAILVSESLVAQGAAAIPRDARVVAFEELHLPTSVALSRATVVRVGQLVSASEVVFGSVELEGTTLTVKARSLQIDAGRFRREIVERGEIGDIGLIASRIARMLVSDTGRTPREEAASPDLAATVEAFEACVKGLLAERPDDQVKLFRAALAKRPSYDFALFGLWEAYTQLAQHKEALAAVRAVPDASPFADRAKFRVGLSQLELGQYEDAFTTFREITDRRQTAAAFNNLGIVQLRRGASAQTGRATYYFNRAAEIDRDDADLVFNLGYAYWLEHDAKGAAYWLREAVRRDPADGDAHYVLGEALQALSPKEATRERELAKGLSSKYAEWERRSAGGESVPKGLERVKDALTSWRPAQLDAAVTNPGQRDQAELATFYFERAQRLAGEGKDAEAVGELRRALYLDPYRAEGLLLLGRIHYRAGRFREAIDVFRIATWSAESVDARVALGEALLAAGDRQAARVEALRALVMDPADTAARALLTRIDQTEPR